MTTTTDSRGPGVVDVILGILITLAGLFVLGNVVLATALSVLVLGWLAIAGGLVGVVASFWRIGRGGFWLALISGILTFVLGLMLVRNPGVGLLSLTLVAGAVFLGSGLMRLVAAVEIREGRVWLIIGGVTSLILGLIVLFNFFEATLTLLGILMGVSLLVDGITLMLTGRTSRARTV